MKNAAIVLLLNGGCGRADDGANETRIADGYGAPRGRLGPHRSEWIWRFRRACIDVHTRVADPARQRSHGSRPAAGGGAARTGVHRKCPSRPGRALYRCIAPVRCGPVRRWRLWVSIPILAASTSSSARTRFIFAPERGGFRHIYMDGRKHPDLTRWTPTGKRPFDWPHGERRARRRHDRHFPGAVTAGGWRTPETHLIERFVVSPDGKHLTINYRWEDPAIYQKPHEYHYEFDRLPQGSYALEYWCDASDPAEQESVTPPSQ